MASKMHDFSKWTPGDVFFFGAVVGAALMLVGVTLVSGLRSQRRDQNHGI